MLRNLLKTKTKSQIQKAIFELTEDQAEFLLYDWELYAREEQLLPPGKWQFWLILAGRGWGKTRTGAETVKSWAQRYKYVNLIGATADDARDIMIQGESGILACCNKWEKPRYKKSERCLEWPNGAKSLIFTADEPERLRGKQHMKLWCDELAAWRYTESWDQAMFGLRLGDNPQAVITTTPRPTKLIKELAKDNRCVVTTGSTYDNKANLASTFLQAIVNKYENTRLGRQELNAEILDDNPNALFNQSRIDELRVNTHPELRRIGIGIDPSVSANEHSDETGIIVAAIGVDGHGYVLHDASLVATPAGWAKVVTKCGREYDVDIVIAETNNGGDLVEANLRTEKDFNFRFKKVHASRGKAIRAEPVAGLYEQGRIHHVGYFPALEDQMCDFNPQIEQDKSPDRMDALVWAFWELFKLDKPDTTGIIEFYRQKVEKKRLNEQKRNSN